jgi:hypothetical protein
LPCPVRAGRFPFHSVLFAERVPSRSGSPVIAVLCFLVAG